MKAQSLSRNVRGGSRGNVRVAAGRGRETIASKYCFSARCPIRGSDLETAAIGLVFGYDAKPTISKDVEDVCRLFCSEAGYVPGDVDLFMHTECPVELYNEVFVTVFETPLEDDVSMQTMHQIAVREQFQRPKPSLKPRRPGDGDDDGDDDDSPPPPPPPFFPRGGGDPPNDPPSSGGKGGPGGSIHRVPKEPKSGGGYELALP